MREVVVRGARLAFGEAGAGAPVVALHASASGPAQWRSLVGYIEGRYRVLTPSLPGYGRSQPPKAAEPGLGGDAGQIAGLLEAQDAPAHLVGHGHGAAVALHVAWARPDLVRSLTLLEPTAFHLLRGGCGGDRVLARAMEEVAQDIAAAARSGRRAAAMAAFVDYWQGPGAWARTSAGLRAHLADEVGALAANLAAVAWERRGLRDYARVGVPALLAFGLESTLASMRVTEMIAEALPRAELRMIPEAGHMAPLTDPHVVDPMIAAHLVAVDRARAADPAAAKAA